MKTGLHFDIPNDDYHADPHDRPSLSSTLARLIINQSPLHAWHASPRLNPNFEGKNSKTFDIGRAAHRSILGQGDDYAVFPADILASNGAATTKEAKAFAEECRSRGITPIKSDEAAQVEAMADAVKIRLAQMGIEIDSRRSEVVALGDIDGCAVRAMYDNLPEGKPWVLDIKTTTNAHPEACIRHVMDYGYDLQIAHYLDVLEAVTGERRKMRLCFVEKEAPYEVSVIELHDDASHEADWMLTARSKAEEARRIWRECLEQRYWPGYEPRIAVVGAPAWYAQKWADREIGNPIPKKPSRGALDAARRAQAPMEAAE